MNTHKDLDIWKEGIKLVKEVYIITKEFPKDELYGLTSQIRRAAVSIPSNIAEGAARNSIKEYIQFLYIALASLSELETQVIISNELEYIKNDTKVEAMIELQRRKLLNFIKFMKTKN